MTIARINGTWQEIQREKQTAASVEYKTAANESKYVTLESAVSDICSISLENDKIGKCFSFNLSIEYTCRHDCECWTKGICYACGGCYLYPDNQAMYSENVNFINSHSTAEIIGAWQVAINRYPNYKAWRFFTIGDIPNSRFIDAMAMIATRNPDMRFWAYTKKYRLVNSWIDKHGDLPENMVILYSHWRNSDGTYFPMGNPHNMPTSEFIPAGHESETEHITHICPCSDPNSTEHCENCEHACYTLKPGESMALLEHSTKATHKRDKELKAAKKALKAAQKAGK